MKKLLIICILFLGVYHLKAQKILPLQDGTHQHNGFYLSMNLGQVLGNVNDQLTTRYQSAPYTLDLSGRGTVVDLKIGWAVEENLILHATYISNWVSNPTIKANMIGDSFGSGSYVDQIGDVMVGAGLTYYIMPTNIFLSGSAGLGKFKVNDIQRSHDNIVSKSGFSVQFKLGKEWWVSKNWALGLGLTYGNTTVTGEPMDGESDKLSSNRFGILLNTTFN